MDMTKGAANCFGCFTALRTLFMTARLRSALDEIIEHQIHRQCARELLTRFVSAEAEGRATCNIDQYGRVRHTKARGVTKEHGGCIRVPV